MEVGFPAKGGIGCWRNGLDRGKREEKARETSELRRPPEKLQRRGHRRKRERKRGWNWNWNSNGNEEGVEVRERFGG